MLSHFQERAEECALRIQQTKSETVRQDYLRIFEGWLNLIQAEEERLARLAHLSGDDVHTARVKPVGAPASQQILFSVRTIPFRTAT